MNDRHHPAEDSPAEDSPAEDSRDEAPRADSDEHAGADFPPAHEVGTAVAALADHFSRVGIPCLPVANPDAAEQLRQRWRADDTGVKPESVQSTPHADSQPPAKPLSPTPSLMQFDEDRYRGEPLPIVDREALLTDLAGRVADCRRCDVLAKSRTQTVFGEGHAAPRFVFLGEGPGFDEDQSGRPFVGASGQLLTKMIAACKLSRDEVYILNVVKCRPPGNRNPDANEISNCGDYLETQLTTLRPEYIVCLGAVAAQSLLQTKASVGTLRGKLHRYRDSRVLATYHPAYLLRNPKAKGAAWQDLKLMLADAGIKP